MGALAIAALVAIPSAPARAADVQAATQPLAVEAFVWTTSPVALRTGLVLGGGAALHYTVGPSGLFIGARLAAAQTAESTVEWDLTHVHLLASAAGGIEKRFGAGLLRAQLEIGVLAIDQLGRRQQYDRLAADGIKDLNRDGWSVGPTAALEVGGAVIFFEPWRVFVQLGPGVTAQKVNGSVVARLFLTCSLGVGRAF